MSKKKKTELSVVEPIQPELTEEQKKAQAEFEEEAKKFDLDERAAYMLEKEYPSILMNALKKMAKEKPNALARVVYNELYYPLASVDLITQDEKDMSKLFSEILAAKRQIFLYTEKRKKQKQENENDKTNKK